MRYSVVGACLAVGIALLGGGCSSSEATSTTFTVTGNYENREVSINDLDFPAAAAAQGIGCSGFRSSPIREGAPLEAVNDKGEVVATGKFGSGRWQTGKPGCVFPFEITKVPAGLKEYRVTVGKQANNGPYSQLQVQSQLSLIWKAR
ncbi:hypothetical protein [Nocardia brasiliensis]|uniref:hypothetical protein n=1 Tax=Nocardia brasiliensis TaxID=37326 RepID=UPI002456EAA5|nr:hypothetical protein [Nocardia brasiliensis]